jgi:glycosyltransferase involved in cell wall biosynthesis
MRFTVVTASYNQGPFIRNCIQSVQAQSAENPSIELEHIIVDACSTDETLSILKQYPHLKWISEPDKGQSDAINKGVGMAAGDWVIWLNADDFLLPGGLRAILERMHAKPSRNVFYGHMMLVGGDGLPVRPLFCVRYRPAMTQYGLCLAPTSGTVFKTSLLRENPLDESYHYVMDTEWFLRTGAQVRACAVQAFTVAFRVWAQSKTGPLTMGGGIPQKHLQERIRYTERHILQRWPSWLRPWQAPLSKLVRLSLLPEYYFQKIYALISQSLSNGISAATADCARIARISVDPSEP